MSALSLLRMRAFLSFAALIVALATMNAALAHTGSTAYLQAEAKGAAVTLRAGAPKKALAKSSKILRALASWAPPISANVARPPTKAVRMLHNYFVLTDNEYL